LIPERKSIGWPRPQPQKNKFPDKKKNKDAEAKDAPAAKDRQSAFETQTKRQQHVLAAWMSDTLKQPKETVENYPIIFEGQQTEEGFKSLQKWCDKWLPAVNASENIRQLEDPTKKQNQKDFNRDFSHKGSPFDQLQTSVETLVFYLKMCGDYKRYLAEMMPDNDGALKKAAIGYYEDAFKTAEMILQATHPTRLGLSLNMSVCYYEISVDKDKACELAKSAFDLAIQQLDGLSDDNYKDSTLIMQLLRDNLTIWQNDNSMDDGDRHED